MLHSGQFDNNLFQDQFLHDSNDGNNLINLDSYSANQTNEVISGQNIQYE